MKTPHRSRREEQAFKTQRELIVDIILGIIINIFSSGLANRIDQVIANVNQSLKKTEPSIQNELHKAIKRSFLSALQDVVLECHKKLYPHKFLGTVSVYPPEYRDDLKWLDRKFKSLSIELKRLEQDKAVETPFMSLSKNDNFWLNPTDAAAAKHIRAAQENFIADVLQEDDLPDCYRTKIKDELFDKIYSKFMLECNSNEKVHNFIVNAKLNQLIEKKETAAATITLVVDINDLGTSRLFEIIEKFQQVGMDTTIKIQRVEAGSVKLVIEGSKNGIRRIEELFKSGKLKTLLGIPVKDVHVTLPVTSASDVIFPALESLREWFSDIFREKWLPADLLLTPAYRGSDPEAAEGGCVRRAKVIDFKKQSVILVVQLTPEQDEEVAVSLQIYPVEGAICLPIGLQVTVLDKSGAAFMEAATDRADKDSMELSWTRESGDKYTVKLVAGDFIVTEAL